MHWALGAIAILIFVSAITPGPNNLVVLGRASARGAKAVAPAVAGIVAGGVTMIALAQFGLGAFFADNGWAIRTVALGGCGYLAWLGVSLIVNANVASVTREPTHAADAFALFAFQFANPKAWVLVLTAVAAAGANNVGMPSLLALFSVISFASLCAWALLGQALQRLREKPRMRAWFDRIMGASLLASTLALAVGQS